MSGRAIGVLGRGGVALRAVAALDEMTIGSPEFREEAWALLRTPPRRPVLWWAAFVASVLVTALLVSLTVRVLLHARHPRDLRAFGSGVGLYWLLGHMTLVPAMLAALRLGSCASSRWIRGCWLGMGLTLAAALATVDATAAWMIWSFG